MKSLEKYIGYEIYPYSFKDGNDDGYGDFKGLLSKIDYLYDLGVNLLWICPFYKSPMDDNGYDVSDYYQINETLGTMDEFKQIIHECHSRGMKVMIDFVLNHLSDEHPWFQEAIKDKNSPYHDFFIFKDPVMKDGKKCLPNNWEGFFSESVWTYVEEIDQYYFHIFSKKMPDLNWENPKLRQEIYKVARFYLDMGVDGFRLDAIAHLAKDVTFSDSELPVNEKGIVLDTAKFSNREELYGYLKEFKEEVLDHYDCITIGEVGGCASCEEALRYVDREKGYITMAFNFDTCWENGAYGDYNKKDKDIKVNVKNMKSLFKKWHDACHENADMPIYWVNHDHPRVMSQYGNVKYHKQSAKMLITTLLFMYGLPFIYQGEEIGMTNVDYEDLDDFKDVSAQNFIRSHKDFVSEEVMLRFLCRTSRINARTPIAWDNALYAGFSNVEPYVKVVGNYPTINVEDNLKDEDSIYKHYQKAIALRKEISSTIYHGSFELLDKENPYLFMYEKKDDEHCYWVISSFSTKNHRVQLPKEYDVLLANHKVVTRNGELIVHPYDSYVIEVKGN